MRSIETIDAELRRLARAWYVAREFGCSPSTARIDAVLDERFAAIPTHISCRSRLARWAAEAKSAEHDTAL
jgi:hypothetical protein